MLDIFKNQDLFGFSQTQQESDKNSKENQLEKEENLKKAQSIQSNQSQAYDMKVNRFYTQSDSALQLIIIIGKIVFVFLFMSIIAVFYSSRDTVDKAK